MLSIDITRRMMQFAVAGALAAIAAPAAWAGHQDLGTRATPDSAAATSPTETKIYDGLDPAIRTAILSHRESRSFGDDLNDPRGIRPTQAVAVPTAANLYAGLDPAIRTAILSHRDESRSLGDDLNGSHAIEPTSQPTASSASGRGFDWSDAGVGAAASAAAAILLALGAVAVSGRRAPGRV